VCPLAFASTGNIEFPKHIQETILKWEGSKFTNDPRDPGGATKYGWTLTSWRMCEDPKATVDTIKNLTEKEAMEAYRVNFWIRYGTCYIKDPELAESVLLAQINLGPRRPNILLQDMTNSFCDSDLKLDGELDKETIHEVNACRPVHIAFPYVLFHEKYIHFKTMKWAKKGLRNRVLDITKDDQY
jgi:lysozyme family protein